MLRPMAGAMMPARHHAIGSREHRLRAVAEGVVGIALPMMSRRTLPRPPRAIGATWSRLVPWLDRR
jgi:hypothetical protein